MYVKCSDLDAAKDVFFGMWRKDVVSWTSIIVGSAQHGRDEEALALYDSMVSTGVKPNDVTFVGLIYACSYAGLVGKGCWIDLPLMNLFGLFYLVLVSTMVMEVKKQPRYWKRSAMCFMLERRLIRRRGWGEKKRKKYGSRDRGGGKDNLVKN
ncbi:hypothetical protein AHAS_Ahas19G0027900 [Arachis hypogaea]